MFKKDDYTLISIKLELDTMVIYNKIIELYPEYSHYKNPEDVSGEGKWSDRKDNSMDDNVKQFLYWHLMKEKQDEIDNTTFAGPPPTK